MASNCTVASMVPYTDWNRLKFPDKDHELAQTAGQAWCETWEQELTALEKRP